VAALCACPQSICRHVYTHWAPPRGRTAVLTAQLVGTEWHTSDRDVWFVSRPAHQIFGGVRSFPQSLKINVGTVLQLCPDHSVASFSSYQTVWRHTVQATDVIKQTTNDLSFYKMSTFSLPTSQYTAFRMIVVFTIQYNTIQYNRTLLHEQRGVLLQDKPFLQLKDTPTNRFGTQTTSFASHSILIISVSATSPSLQNIWNWEFSLWLISYKMAHTVTQHTNFATCTLLSRCLTVSRYRSTRYCIYAHENSSAFHAPIFHEVHKGSTVLRADALYWVSLESLINVPSADRHAFKPVSEAQMSLRPCWRHSQRLSAFLQTTLSRLETQCRK
jgi:hypothetical protein